MHNDNLITPLHTPQHHNCDHMVLIAGRGEGELVWLLTHGRRGTSFSTSFRDVPLPHLILYPLLLGHHRVAVREMGRCSSSLPGLAALKMQIVLSQRMSR